MYKFAALIVAIIFVFGAWLQNQLFISHDILWLVEVGRKMLAGGNYYHDFFEVNPPMSIYLYLPVLGIAKLLAVTSPTAIILYILLLALVSLGLCTILLNKIFFGAGKKFVPLLIIGLAFVYILLPGSEFGQREQCTLMLTMPYLFLTVLRIENKNINLIVKILIGLIAGVGFVIKPYFLIIWFLMEFYALIKTKRWFFSLRPEGCCVYLVAIIYVISIFIITPEYIEYVLPFIDKYYYATWALSWSVIFSHAVVSYWLVITLIYFLLRRDCIYKTLADIFWLASLGFLVTYLLQRTIWYYHWFPLLAVSSLLLLFLLWEFSLRTKNNLSTALMVVSGSVLLYFPLLITGIESYDGLYTEVPTYQPFVDVIKSYARGQYVYFIGHQDVVAAPWVDYAGAFSSSRFFCLWMLPGMMRLSDPQLEKNLPQDEQFIINAVIEDFERHPPRLVFIDTRRPGSAAQPDFLGFFLRDQRFQQLWKHYSYLTIVRPYIVYQKD